MGVTEWRNGKLYLDPARVDWAYIITDRLRVDTAISNNNATLQGDTLYIRDSTLIPLTGSSSGSTSVGGEFVRQRYIETNVSGISSINALISQIASMDGFIQGSTSVSPNLGRIRPLDTDVSGYSTVISQLLKNWSLTGVISGASTVTGEHLRWRYFYITSTGQSDIVGIVLKDIAPAASSYSQTVATASSSVIRSLKSQCRGESTTSGSMIRRRYLSGQSSGKSTAGTTTIRREDGIQWLLNIHGI